MSVSDLGPELEITFSQSEQSHVMLMVPVRALLVHFCVHADSLRSRQVLYCLTQEFK